MSEKRALYLSIAQRCAEKGENGRAIITIVNALRNNPQFLETQPEAIDFLASILTQGFEEEIHKLETRYPSFSVRLTNALVAHGKADLARHLERSFEEYCFERMKDVQNSAILSYSTQMPADFLSSQSYMQARACPSSQSFSQVQRVEPSQSYARLESVAPERSYARLESVDRPQSFSRLESVPAESFRQSGSYSPSQTLSPDLQERVRPADSPSQTFVPNTSQVMPWDPGYRQTAAGSGFYRPTSRPGWRKQTTGESCEQLPSVVSELPGDVWMPSIQDMALHHGGQTGYEKREFASRNNDSCSTDGIRRFDRIRTQCSNDIKAEDYADTAADRVILDFDNRVRETPKAAMFAATKQKFRSFAEDQAQWRAESQTEQKRPLSTSVQNPFEAVAETTQALTDTPSVEPYSVRNPLRFQLTPQNVMTCALVCLIAMFGFFAWRTAEPALEKKAIESVSQTYLKAAEMGVANPVDAIDTTPKRYVSDGWMVGYRQFLTVWQNLYHTGGEEAFIDPEDPDFAADISAAHAAYIMQETSRNHIARARMYFENVPADIWRDHPYFKTWSEAELDLAAKDYRTASIRYEKLLRTPLAPFALVRMGLLSLEEGPNRNDIQHRFVKSAEAADFVPSLARCAYSILTHENGDIPEHETGNLKSPFAEYCSMGRIFSAIKGKDLLSLRDLEKLEISEPLAHGESYRLEAIIEGELYRQQASNAINFYKTLDLPTDHPLRKRLLSNILSRAMYFGNWEILHALNEDVKSDISYMAAARIVDNARIEGVVAPDGRRAESLLKYGMASAPAAVSSLMDEAIVEAEHGRYERALNIVRSVLSARPDAIEPLYLQALVLSQMGNAADAAVMLEHAMASENASAPLIVLSNLYRVRGNLDLNHASFALRFLSFEDPVLESARCEIFWRLNAPEAESCLARLEKRDGKQAKSTWIMRHLDERRKPIGNAAQWAKAGSGSISFPGFHLAYARKLIEAGDFQAATKAYTKAILNDTVTSTPEVIDEFAKAYIARQRRYEGTKKFESLIKVADSLRLDNEIRGSLHLAAARLYQPENGHSTARQHLGSALELLGDRPEILRGFVQYYESKGKEEQAATWRGRLNRILRQ